MFPGPVCVALTPVRVADVFSAEVTGADCIEVRLDCLEDPGESTSVRWDSLPVPVIATCRGRQEGGHFEGSIDEQCQILNAAVRNGARYVDVDFRHARRFGAAEVIGSYHDFDKTPTDLMGLMRSICEAPVAVAKIATMVESWTDNRRLLDVMEKPWPKPVIVIGMGRIGQITRILGPSRGSGLTYVSATRASAPGQFALRELLDSYGFRKIGPKTRTIGIVGDPVEHSASPALLNRAFDAAGLDFVYLKFPVVDVGDFFENLEAIGISGFSVTIPHKVAIMDYLDVVSEQARSVGAVNTVYREDGQWKGDNTDVHGIRESVKDLDIPNLRVLILGTGGAARAAVAALREARSVTLFSHTREPGDLDWARKVPVDRLSNLSRYEGDLLINATPVGMVPDVDQTPVSGVIPAEVVFDMVYKPAQTRLLREAQDLGKRTIPGMTMLLAQATRQFEIWTGRQATPSLFSAAPE